MFRGVVFVFLTVCTLCVQATPLTAADFINLSGRQRMLTQRIVKAYAQVGTGLASAQSQRVLTESTEQFSLQLTQLRAVARQADQRSLLAEIESLWPEVQGIASKPINRDLAPTLQEKANILQALSHRLADLIERTSGVAAGRLVNIAGRQRMLSQRLAKAYMLRAWDIDSPAISRELESSRLEFSEALAALAQAPENTPEIRRELEAIAVQWVWFQAALELEGAVSYRLLVADSSESMLASLEKLVSLYTRLDR